MSESREITFDHDIADTARLESILRELAARLCEGLRCHGRRGRTIRVKIRLADFTTVTRARTLDHATDDPAEVGEVAVRLLREYGARGALRLLGVGVTGFAGDEDEGAAARDQLALPV